MTVEVTESKRPTDWKAKLKEMAPLATCLLILSATYMLFAETQGDRTAGMVGVCLGIALVSLPAIWLVVGRLHASGWRVFRSWVLLFPVAGWIAGVLLWRWIKGAFF